MDIGSILLILALALLVGVFVSQPFSRSASRQSRSSAADPEETPALQAERERLLNALSELDNDYSMGKVPVEDYPLQRAALVQAGALVLRKLDELKPVEIPQTVKTAVGQKLCSHCRAALHSDDLFCPRCGHKVL